MLFTAKAEYGVRLMLKLGRQGTDRPTSLKAIADAEGLPLAYLEQVVAALRKADLVLSARGAHGGYWLARDPATITMFEVIAALEGTIAPMECFVREDMERVVCAFETGQALDPCATRLLWLRVQGGIERELRNTTLAELVDFSRHELHDRHEIGAEVVTRAANVATTISVAGDTAPAAGLAVGQAAAV
jgi:Rrf2 family cysteine metabolism transcriptional repressor